MIDYARPFEPNMCDIYLPPVQPAHARLDDFQNIFKKGNTSHIYGNYYTNYDVYTEQEVDTAANVYHNLVSSHEYRHEDWKYKVVMDWTEDDTVSWVIDCADSHGYTEYEVPFYNFKLPGVELRHMRIEEINHRMAHPSVDPILSRKIANTIFDKLQTRLNEEMLRQSSVFRYADSDPYQHHEPAQTMLDLDKYRLYPSDHKISDVNLSHAADSDDAEDVFRDRSSETASPEFYGSDVSKSGDEEDKRKQCKRPPGRPKGSGRKVPKRPRSVSVPEFLRNLLFDEKYCPSIIKWENHVEGKFRFVKPDEVAKLWGQMKQNENMTFEKFSRAMRYHYRQGVLVSVPTARLVYQFGHNGPDFKTDNPNFINIKTETEVHDMPYS